MSASTRTRPSRFERTLDIVRRLLAGETVTSPGPPEVLSARVEPRPAEPLEVWIGAGAPPAIDRAARLGDAFIAGPESTAEQAQAIIDQYLEACARHGRTPASIVIRRDVHVGAYTADAHRVADPILDAGYRGFDRAATVVGGDTEVADELGRFADMGYTDVLIRHLSTNQTEVLASFERLASVATMLADR